MLTVERMRRAGMFFLVLGCAHPSRQECEQVIDRYVDMKLGDDPEVTRAPESARPTVRDAQRAKKRSEQAYGTRVSQCMEEVDKTALACGMNAPDPNQWEACFR